MNINEFIDLLKEYNFINNSVKSFSERNNVCCKTIIKYLKIENIKYNNQKGIITIKNRDANGRSVIGRINNSNTKETSKQTTTNYIKQNNKTKSKLNNKDKVREIKKNLDS